MFSFWQDLKYSLRIFARNPATTLVIVATLALGIGANTAIFSLINVIVLTPLPVHDPSQLIVFGTGSGCCVNGGIPSDLELFSYDLFRDLRDHDPHFSGIAAVRAEKDLVRIRLAGSDRRAELSMARLVSANYFEVIGTTLASGSGFTRNDDVGEGAHPVVVISDHLRRQMLGSVNPIGKTLVINSTPFTIVGVTAPEFYGERLEAEPAEMWVPLSMQPQVSSRESFLASRDTAWLYLFGRPKPGANLVEAEVWVKTRVQSYLAEVQGPGLDDENRRIIASLRFQFTSGEFGTAGMRRLYSDFLRLLMAFVGLLLLICCCNVANLLLARATSRQNEITTRMALGAGRWRILREVLAESALLGLIGGGLGLIFAFDAAHWLLALVLRGRFVPIHLSPDPRVLSFTLLTTAAATAIFGVVPAIHTLRTRLVPNTQSFSPTVTGRLNLGGILVVSQIAISLVLIVVAGLFVRSLNRFMSQELGFDTRVIDANIDPAKSGYDPAQLEHLYARISDRLKQLPGVQSVTLAQYAPFGGNNWMATVLLSGGPRPADDDLSSRWFRVSSDYVSSTGMVLLAGRDIDERDRNRPVAVVNEQFVKVFAGNQNPIGRQVSFSMTPEPSYEIIGVVRDARYQRLNEELRPTFYIPLLEGISRTVATGKPDDSIFVHDVLVRVSNPATTPEVVHRALLEVDPDLAIRSVLTLRQQVNRTFQLTDALEKLSTSLGVLALLLACLGLYGLMTYAVARRTRELGIRLALGANARTLVRMILRQSAILMLVGIAIGTPLAWIAARLTANMLFGVGPSDPLVYCAGCLVLAAAAMVAAYLPARRAAQTDPAVILRAA